jgi:membrane dipeptidase
MAKASKVQVFDGHNDVLLRLYRAGDTDGSSFFEEGKTGDLDYPRGVKGGFAGGFFAVYIPPDPSIGEEDIAALRATMEEGALPPALEPVYAYRTAMGMVALLFRLEARSGGKVKVVRTVDELSACLKGGMMAAICHFEGAEAIDPDLGALEVFYKAGLRSLGPVWSRPTIFADGVPFRWPHSPDTGPGLTDIGKALVKECNRLGIMIDLSHLNEKGFWDVAKLSDAPLVATHSNVHALCAATRNLTDKQLDAIRESDGMVGLNFGCGFLRDDGKSNADTALEVLVRHIDYLVERLGIDRVGLGSDFDGATMPNELSDASKLPNLMNLLGKSGYDNASLQKLGHENWVRVLGKTWKV